jgi:hypothetical protein
MDDVLGAYVGNDVKCTECMTEDDWQSIDHRDQIIESALVEVMFEQDEILFCDKCNVKM